jgi:enoyl-CoA hydratase/long-chain 3-hydroxyacyl-CoA dehydrogenase
LGCHYRIALNDKRTTFGLPEVKLGLLPGAGGTQRILQKLSLTDALDLLLTGKEIKAKKAKAMGLVDILVESDSQDIDYLRSIAVQKAKYVINQSK